MTKLTQELVQSLFTYRDGNLYWKVSLNRRIQLNDKAGTLNKISGRYQIRISNKSYKAHRLIFLYHNGYLPEFVDHIDRNPLNNNIENLREVTRSQNNMNRKENKDSSSKYKGITYQKNSNKWITRIRFNNKQIYLGLFINEIDAALAYNDAAIKYFGEFGYLNKIGDD